MPTLPLRLIPTAAPQPVQAGFLPGSDTAAWLVEMARHPGGRFYIVPNSVEESEAGGLLLVPMGSTTAKLSRRTLPCVIELGRVIVPCGSRLDPMLSTEEAGRLLTYPLYFFHPALGLVAFEDADAITPQSLIVPPLPRESSWLHALPGHPPFPKLNRVMLALPDELDQLFGDAAEDIGKLSPKDLQEKSPPLDRIKDKLIAGAAGMALGGLAALGILGRLLGGKGGAQKPPPLPGAGAGANTGKGTSPNTRGIPMMDKLMRWTADQMQKLLEKRERELERLMKLLESDPDQGLRYALPIGGAGDASRGTAPPSWRLSERNPLFGSRRGGGPADTWDLSPQTQWQLQQKYRDLANRELAAGRFDRAAYIFAELLGDWHAAAGALARGKRHQEAARIYLTKLNNKVLAAQCLENGGLITDAVLLYAELGQHEKCGDLLRQIGREQEAIAAYHQAIKDSTDRLQDARILFEKLRQHQMALQVLASGYPNSPQAAQCLERHFAYLAELDATADALLLARSLGAWERQIRDRVLMTQTLRSIHQAQTAPEVRRRLGIVATTIIGEALASSPSSQDATLLATLPQFAASDLLLRRDTQRFTEARETQRRSQRSKTSTSKPGMTFSHRGSIQLPQDKREWWSLRTQGDEWLAIGNDTAASTEVYVLGEGEKIIGQLAGKAGWTQHTQLCPILPPVPEWVWLSYKKPNLPARYGLARKGDFTRTSTSPDLLVSRLAWLPQHVLAAHPQADGVWVAHQNVTQTIDLSFYSYDGHLIRTHALGWTPETKPESPPLLAVHGQSVLLSYGAALLYIQNGRIIGQMEQSARMLELHVTKPVQPAAFLAVTEDDVVLVSPTKRGELDSIQLFNTGAGSTPKGCFLNDGHICVGDDKTHLLYSAYPGARLLSQQVLAMPGRVRPGAPAAYAAWGAHGMAVLQTDWVIDLFS